MTKLSELVVIIRGGGEVASGIAYRLHILSNMRICLIEVAVPRAIARGVTFCEAVFEGTKTITGVTAELVPADEKEIQQVWQKGNIPLIIDPVAAIREKIKPDVLVDAIMAKRKTSTKIADAPLVIGVGPGFYAGRDVHVVVESNYSSNLGKLIFNGEAEKDTGIPVAVDGLAKERVLWSSKAGVFTSNRHIGDSVVAGEIIAQVGVLALRAPMGGVLRGLIRSGVTVAEGTKLIEVYPTHDGAICSYITYKVMAIGEGVFEAVKQKYG